MGPRFTRSDWAEIADALEVQADAAHDEWRESAPGAERKAAHNYKRRIARLQAKIDRILGGEDYQ